MAVLSTLFPTIIDLAKKTDPNGGIATVVELLAKKNAFLQDLAFKQGNLPTGHRFSARVALPSPSWRKLNQGIAASKGQVDTYEENCGMLEGLAKVDCALAELNGDAAAFRADEDNAFVSAFGLEVASALFYSSVNGGTNNGFVGGPEKIHGLTPRFDVTSGNVASGQIIKAGGTGSDQTSIWLVGWGPHTVYGIYPKSGTVGFKSEDLGKQIVKDSGGTNEYTAYVTHHKWSLGLAVEDYRYIARICNIDTGSWEATTPSPDIGLYMMDAIAAMFEMESVQPVMYCNRSTFSMFNKQLMNKKTTNFMEYVERGGTRIPHFLGIPIRISDAIVNTEAQVS